MKLRVSLLTVLLGACATAPNTGQSADGLVQSRLFVSAPGSNCSFQRNNAVEADKESLGTALASVIVPRLIGAGIDAAGKALKAAAAESTKVAASQTVSTNLYGFVHTDKSVTVAGNKFCVRALVAKFPKTTGLKVTASEPSITSDTFADPEQVGIAISNWLGATSDSGFKPMAYIEYEVTPTGGSGDTANFSISPVVIWYGAPIHGGRYRLVSASLSAQAPGADADAFTVPTIFNSASGTEPVVSLQRDDLVGLQASAVKGPALDPSVTSKLAELTATISSRQSNEQLELRAASQSEIDALKRELAKAQCIQNATGKDTAEGVSVSQFEAYKCEKDFEIDVLEEVKKLSETEQDTETLTLKKTTLEESLVNAGTVNLKFEITESRRPDKYLAAFAEALSNENGELTNPFAKVFLGPQRSDEDRKDAFTARWTYETALEDYEIKKARYEALLVQTDPVPEPQDLDAAREAYREAGLELGEAAVAVGKTPPL